MSSQNRITRRLNNDIIEFVDGKGYAKMTHVEGIKLLFSRLAEYEDSGLSPEEVTSQAILIDRQAQEIEEIREFWKGVTQDQTKEYFKANEAKEGQLSLAIKALEEIQKGDDSYHTELSEAKRWIDKVEDIAECTLDQIRRIET